MSENTQTFLNNFTNISLEDLLLCQSTIEVQTSTNCFLFFILDDCIA